MAKNQLSLEHMRHSAAHLLAAAVTELYPNTKRAIGPAITNGFYYDFDFAEPISESDLPRIEKRMREIIKLWRKFEREDVKTVDAVRREKGNPYKTELIKEFGKDAKTVSYYKAGKFSDLCKGGHVNDAKEIGPFKLTHLAGAYWRGSEKNKMLTRIYGTVWPTQKELDEYLLKIEEAKKRDHKKLGKELGLFTFSEAVGKGLPLWTPRGTIIRKALEDFVFNEETKRGYNHVYTPEIANLDLYKKSGHYPYYKESMYSPIQADNEQFMLRPMSCPHHYELYLSEEHSYREFPIRIAELARLFRYEKSGELSGLERVREFELSDAHIFARPDQVEEEIDGALDLIEFAARKMGLEQGTDYHYRLSLGDRKNTGKYFKDDKAWDRAEKILASVLKKRKSKFVELTGEAAFYGPKIDIQMYNANGKEDTAFTVQYDFVMPNRFNLAYTNERGTAERPIVIHRSSIGSIERVVAFLIEKHAGAFPLWLAPEQVRIIPIADRHIKYAEQIKQKLGEFGTRVHVDDTNNTVGKKIRSAEVMKIPFALVVGDNELKAKNVSVRKHGSEKIVQKKLDSFILELKKTL